MRSFENLRMKGDSSAANGVLIDSFIIRPEGCVTVPGTLSDDVAKMTLASIVRQAGSERKPR